LPRPRGKLSAWWANVQRSWNEHISEVRKHIDERQASHNLEAVQREADSAEEDAAFAVDYAYAAIEEAPATAGCSGRGDEHPGLG
jgi:hypothetical protein